MLPRWLSGCRRHRLNLQVEKIPWRRAWQPTPVFCLGNPMDSGAWRAAVPESQRAGLSERTALQVLPWRPRLSGGTVGSFLLLSVFSKPSIESKHCLYSEKKDCLKSLVTLGNEYNAEYKFYACIWLYGGRGNGKRNTIQGDWRAVVAFKGAGCGGFCVQAIVPHLHCTDCLLGACIAIRTKGGYSLKTA